MPSSKDDMQTKLGLSIDQIVLWADLLFYRKGVSYYLLHSCRGDQPSLDYTRVVNLPDLMVERISEEQGLLVVVLCTQYFPLSANSYNNLIAKYLGGEKGSQTRLPPGT